MYIAYSRRIMTVDNFLKNEEKKIKKIIKKEDNQFPVKEEKIKAVG